ncbi:GAF and ANTAR domain-containing protein [Allosalinactinospora lopnorensis]|uniref:GAF and ANTAR domain-containing protein n=1 Tax=Allosalinactinospora lopnorensis TaxID=1352348 RepID=UPI000623DF4F|nr:GAF and ANTAR domain-containing protein [Allosalinactinospora lopnorensis]
MDREHELAHRFAEVAKQLSADRMTAGLQQAVDLATQMIPGCDYAGITISQPGSKVFTPASTGRATVEVDQLQYDIGEGPCLDIATSDVGWVQSDDVGTDPRWPRFGASAQKLGISSVLSYGLESPRGMLGVLNLYSQKREAFDASTRDIASIYAAHAGAALSAQRMQESLRAAMDSRESIGIAIGILVERHKVTASHAFDMLTQVSQDTNTKLRELAERVAATGQEPGVQ